jgi:hypothetical protein
MRGDRLGLGLAVAVCAVARLAPGLPGMAPWRGPLGLLLVGLAASALLPSPRWSIPAGVGPGLAFALFAAVGLHYTASLRVTGDEPHYLIMAQSLAREGDLDLRDNYAREDWREYTPGPLVPHYGEPRPDGRPWPAHSPGLPLLLAPVYALGGRRACVVVLALAAAGLTALLRRLAVPEGPAASTWAWLAGLGPPLLYYSFHVYTEGVSALALAGSMVLLLEGAATPAVAVAAALLASALPWLHLKMAPAAVALGVVALVRLRGRSRLAFVATAGLCAVGFLAYYAAIYGTPTPLAIYGGAPQDMNGRPLAALLGLFLDRSFGLLPQAPLLVLALAGVPPLLRRARDSWPHLLVGAAVLLPVLGWRMWWGGQCPPGRFLVPLLPLLALAVAIRVAEAPQAGLARFRGGLLAAGLGLGLFAAADPGALLLVNRGDRPTRLWEALSAEVPLGSYLPSLVARTPAERRVAGVWLVLLAALLLLDRAAIRFRAVDAAASPLAVALLPLACLAIERWARAGP